MIERIISGGQTGADRGGLDAAIILGIAHGGSCPRGRRAEDGVVPRRYRLKELVETTYLARTRQNVVDADATVIFTHGAPKGGSRRTLEFARQYSRPHLCIDLERLQADPETVLREFVFWVRVNVVRVLNVAGSRESEHPGTHAAVKSFLLEALARLSSAPASAEQSLAAEPVTPYRRKRKARKNY